MCDPVQSSGYRSVSSAKDSARLFFCAAYGQYLTWTCLPRSIKEVLAPSGTIGFISRYAAGLELLRVLVALLDYFSHWNVPAWSGAVEGYDNSALYSGDGGA